MLCAKNLGVAFDGRWLFRGVSWSIEPGQRIALVGPSGSGKSMLLKALATLHRADEGSVFWNGDLVEGQRVTSFRSQVMYVPQKAADNDSTVADYLSVPFRLKAHQHKQYSEPAAIELLQSLDRSGEFLAKSQRELSGGEHQIAALVRAILLDPAILLLDEPTASLDGHARLKVESLVHQWCRKADKSILWVTHDLEQAERVASKVVELATLVGDT